MAKEEKPEPTWEDEVIDLMTQQLRCLQSLRENVRFFVFMLILLLILQVVGWFLRI